MLIAAQRYDKIGTPIEVLVGLALARRQADVQFLLCDQSMPVCDVRRIDRDTAANCEQCWHNGHLVLGSSGLPVWPFRQWLRAADAQEATAIVEQLPQQAYTAFCLDGVQLGRIAYASTLRYFLRGSLTTDQHWDKMRAFLITAVLMLRLAQRALADLKPEAIFISHGIYVTWGVLTELAAAQGIRVVVYGYGYRKGTILLANGASYHNTLVNEDKRLWAERALRPDETRTIRDYLASRANGGMDWIKYNTGTRRDPDALRALYGLRADRPTYVLFTNVAWDAAVVFHHTAFRDMETWLLGTVHWFVEHPELQLIVRCHPAESHQLHESQQTAAHIIKSALPHLPAHIRVIAAEADVNSYDLTELAATTLVYTTKVGLEFATRNIPVIVAGEAFYRGKGFTYDPATETEYFELLRSGPPKPLDRQAEWALRYAHYYFFRRYMEVRGLKDSGIGQPVLALEIDHLSQLDAGVDRQMDVICDAILQGSLPLVDGF